ncbi:carbonic anhydrase, partial [Campylobacter coli]|nr:carbonic anhydrase [Campylobacter coli]EKO0396017.1 carbonic anhydrase [Campylobacter coli]
ALNSLRIKNIVVCGHSNCGGCNALYYSDEELDKIPNVKKWLTMLDPIKRDVTIFARDDIAMRSWLTEKLNLVNSLQNIFTYPGVQEALDEGRLEVHAWYYIIETGEIYEYDFKTKIFKLIQNRKMQ